MRKIFYTVLLGLLLIAPLNAQEKEKKINTSLLERLREMSLEDIMDRKISVATEIPLSMREAPGSVTLITRDDILNSGARDLIDVFNLLVPGFNFMQSEYGPIGIGVRNMWAYEGKVLLLIDGVEANDDGFGGFLFGNHLSPENIERIEVIRGPGSVVYGNLAGLGVINIITRDFNKRPGSYVGFQISRMYETFSHRNLSFGVGDNLKYLSYSFTGFVGEGKLSERNYSPYFSDEFINSSKIKFNPLFLNLKAKSFGYDLQVMYERYNIIFDIPYKFNTIALSLSKDFKVTNNFTIKAKVNQKWQEPWKLETEGIINLPSGITDTLFANHKRSNKTQLSVKTVWKMFKNLNLLSGIDYNYYSLRANPEEGYVELPIGNAEDGNQEYDTYDYNIYAQLIYKTSMFNVIYGGRYTKTRTFGDGFVPRIALTKIIGGFHFKLMASKSFRVPGGKYYDTRLKPEKGDIYEIELGYQLNKNHFFVFNLYDIQYNSLISLTKSVNPDTKDISYYYINQDKFHSRGFELEYKLVTKVVRLGANLSFSKVVENTNPEFTVPGDDKKVLGFPSVGYNIFAGINFSEHLSINPSFSYYGSRYGYIEGDINYDTGDVSNVLKQFEPTPIFNVNFRTKDLITKGLQIDLGVKNILNNRYEFIQPFNGYNAPLPAPSSAVVLRIYYESNFTF